MTGDQLETTGSGPARLGDVPVVAVPPPLAGALIRRARLEALLDEGATRRLTTIVAAAGFGKSTLLAVWGQAQPLAWHTVTAVDRDVATLAAGIVRSIGLRAPAVGRLLADVIDLGRGPQAAADESRRAEALAGAICDAIEGSLTGDLVLVLDDLETLARRDAASRLVAALCRQAPARLHVMLSSRTDLPFPIERLRIQGQVLSLTGADLAFSREETGEFLAAMLRPRDTTDGAGAGDQQLAERLHAATGGWPAASRLAAEALVRVEADARPAMLDRLVRTADPVVEYFVEQVVARESPAVRKLIGTMALVERFTIELAAALGFPGIDDALDTLVRSGLVVQAAGDGEWFAIHPAVRPFAVQRLAPHGRARADVHRSALDWALANGADLDALTIAIETQQPSLIRRALTERGQALLTAGHIDPVIDAAGLLRGSARTRTIDRLEGEARQVRGDWDGALALFQRLHRRGTPLEPGIAWRMGLIHHLRGELDEAIRIYAEGASGPITDASGRSAVSADRALLQAWWAAALWLRGEVDEVRRLVDEALPAATRTGDPRALAVTHTVLAMLAALDGDRRANDLHYLRALDHAIRGRDVLTQIRIRANRGSRFIEEGSYGAALEELDEAIRLAEMTGFAIFQALALSNRGEALWRLGRFDDARADLEQARAMYQGLDSAMVAYPLGHLGDVYRDRGDQAMARAQYEEALSISERSGDLQGLVPALAGLSRVLAAEEPDRARSLAARAVALGPALARVAALLAQARVALQAGDRSLASSATSEAAALARGRRDRAGLAEALELEAALATRSSQTVSRLQEARAIWHDLGAVVAEARVEVALDAARGAASPSTASAQAAHAVLAAAGATVPPPAGNTGAGAAWPATEIRSLGGFSVQHAGAPVPIATWGSRRARDLVKILVARRGQRVPREQLMEVLWPDEDPIRTARRLSVMISTARNVLDPDRSADPVGWIAADRDAVWLALPAIAIDVERFMAGAVDGLDTTATDPVRAQEALEQAEAAYRGDFLEDDPYADWAVPLREEAKATYLRVALGLARLWSDNGDAEAAIRYLRRALEREPYDEHAHLLLATQLVAAGRPAEARRTYRTYVGRMEELDVEAAPFPGVGTAHGSVG